MTTTRYLLWTGLEGGDVGWMDGGREGGREVVCILGLVGSGEGILLGFDYCTLGRGVGMYGSFGSG